MTTTSTDGTAAGSGRPTRNTDSGATNRQPGRWRATYGPYRGTNDSLWRFPRGNDRTAKVPYVEGGLANFSVSRRIPRTRQIGLPDAARAGAGSAICRSSGASRRRECVRTRVIVRADHHADRATAAGSAERRRSRRPPSRTPYTRASTRVRTACRCRRTPSRRASRDSLRKIDPSCPAPRSSLISTNVRMGRRRLLAVDHASSRRSGRTATSPAEPTGQTPISNRTTSGQGRTCFTRVGVRGRAPGREGQTSRPAPGRHGRA